MKILIPHEFLKSDFVAAIHGVSSNIEILFFHRSNPWARFQKKWKAMLQKYGTTRDDQFDLNFQITSLSGGVLNNELDDVKALLHSWVIDRGNFQKLLSYLPNLQWVHTMLTGVDRLMAEEFIKSNIVLTNSSGARISAVAEFVVAMIFELAKRLHEHFTLQKRKAWSSLESIELEGKTIGIIGFGKIGQEIAKKISGFNMKVVAIKKNVYSLTNPLITLLPLSKLDQMLSTSDFVIICAPLTNETAGMIGKEQFEIMKNTAYLINVSRGGVLDEEALVEALNKRKIAGAYIDVFNQEPLPVTSPLYRVPNLFITHHSAYKVPSIYEEDKNFFIDNLRRFYRGEPLLNIVNKELGY